VRRTCDNLLRIPMSGGVSSLNVSAAGAVVLFEAARQRRAVAAGTSPTPVQAALPHPFGGLPAKGWEGQTSKLKKQKGLGS
jgi:23S rRNA (guanosine2251-2'-O)-methyltransferase